jgi:glycolate oxidase
MRPSLLEIIDRPTLAAIEAYRPMGLDVTAAALLLGRSDAGGERGVAEIESMAAACERAGATLVEHTDDPAEGEMYVAVRRMAYPAIEATGSEVLIEDVAVPLPELPGMLADLDTIAATHGVLIATVGHAGDGNLHPLVVFDRHDADATARAERGFDAIMAAAIRRGGTITGEHGVGLLKRRYLGDQLGADVLRVHRAIKAALDPDDVFNPGKVL